MTHHESYNIYPNTLAAPFDTIVVAQPLSLTSLAKNLGVPLKELRELNPAFKFNLIPAFVKSYTVRVPERTGDLLNEQRHSILQAAAARLQPAQKQVLLAGNIASALRLQANLMQVFTDKKKVMHLVQGSEAIDQIATRYQVAVSEIENWNYLANQKLKAGQKLVLYVDKLSHPAPFPGTPETSAVARIKPIESKAVVDLASGSGPSKLAVKLPNYLANAVASN